MYSLILPSGNAQVFYDLCNVGDDATHFFAFPEKQVFVDQIFRIFDKDGNGSIDFKVRINPIFKCFH